MDISQNRNGRHTWRRMLPFALILALALVLRLRGLDTTGIWNDQAFTLGTAMRWVNGGDVPLAANVSSVGFINPPMIEYLYAMALRIWPDVLSVALLTLLSGMLAIVAAGWVTCKIFGRRAAFWTMLIFAINPWSVFYSQLIWNQTLVPLFSTLMFVSLVLYFAVERRPGYLISSFVWAACMTQVHPGSSPQLLTMGVLFVIFWRRLKVWHIAAGIGAFLLIYTPYLLFENGVGWRDVTRILELMGQPTSTSIASLLVSFDLLQAQGLWSDVKNVVLFDDLATLVLAGAVLISLFLGVRSFAKRSQSAGTKNRVTAFTILFIWFFLPMLFYLRSSELVYVQPYYLVGQIPAHFLFIGITLSWAQERFNLPGWEGMSGTKRHVAQFVTWFIMPLPLLVLLGWQVSFNLQFQDARAHNLPMEAQVRQIRSAIGIGNELLAERPDCLLVVISEGHTVEQSYLSLLREFTVPERVILSDGQYAVPLPDPCAIYLDALPGSRASNWLGTEAVEIADTRIDVPNAVWHYSEITRGERQRLIDHFRLQGDLPRWENGVALQGYERGSLEAGGNVGLTLIWSVVSPPVEKQYHTGTYLLTGENQLVAQYDGPGFDSIQWRQGDMFITWADIPVPSDITPGDYQLGIAYYSWPDVVRVNLLSGENMYYLEQVKVE